MNNTNYWWTSDEHFGHLKILLYSNRPFQDLHEMHCEIINRHNSVVSNNDIVIHCGDFAWQCNYQKAMSYAERLNGQHVFIRGSHDRWLPRNGIHEIWEKTIDGHHVVACHYAMRTWPRSHYNSWCLYGHSHGGLKETFGKSMDVGVDTNNFFPYSFEQIKEIMEKKPDNFNLVKG